MVVNVFSKLFAIYCRNNRKLIQMEMIEGKLATEINGSIHEFTANSSPIKDSVEICRRNFRHQEWGERRA